MTMSYLDMADAEDARHTVGANNPPGPIEDAQYEAERINQFLSDTPIIADTDTANNGARLVKNLDSALKAVEAERTSKVKPLNDEVKTINDRYKTARGPVEKILDVLKARLTAFARVEEARRYQEAEAKRKAAAEAERIAREKETAEREALDNAGQGEIGVDVAAVTAEADQAFSEAEKAARDAARAERNTPVKLASDGFGRALSLRTKETLHLDDAAAAMAEIGMTDDIREAILKAARAFRKLNDRLPAGVRSELDRSL